MGRMFRGLRWRTASVVALIVAGSTPSLSSRAKPDLPTALTDQDFWRLTEELSEPTGAFAGDNLLSNETPFGWLVPTLDRRAIPTSVYLGVGPEQNFTYIASLKPRLAFVLDIRRGNLYEQLMYKALFELSADRADFLSRLFTKPRPASVNASTSVADLMNGYWDTFTADEATYAANLAALQAQLTHTHQFPLSSDDLTGIARIYRAFYWYGPSMNYLASTSLTPSTGDSPPTFFKNYWDLMTQADSAGQGLSYLASEDRFKVVKDLERRNLVIPVVGNFAGPKALRAIGAYVRDHRGIVSAFYVSNVESYLVRDGLWSDFCANVMSLPLDQASLLIRPSAIPAVTRTTLPDGTIRTTSHYPSTGSSGLLPIGGPRKGVACGVPGLGD